MLKGQGCSEMKASVILFNLSLEIRKARFKERQILGSGLLGLGGRVGVQPASPNDQTLTSAALCFSDWDPLQAGTSHLQFHS